MADAVAVLEPAGGSASSAAPSASSSGLLNHPASLASPSPPPDALPLPRLARQWTLGSDDPDAQPTEDSFEKNEQHESCATITRSKSGAMSSPPMLPRSLSTRSELERPRPLGLLQRQYTLPSDELAGDIEALNQAESEAAAAAEASAALKRKRPNESADGSLLPRVMDQAKRVAGKLSELCESDPHNAASNAHLKRVKTMEEGRSHETWSQLSDSLDRVEADLDAAMQVETSSQDEAGSTQVVRDPAALARQESWQMDESEVGSWRIL